MKKRFIKLAGGLGGAVTYQGKVLGLNPIAYWPLTETSGTVATAVVGVNGTYARNVSTMGTAAGPITGQTAPTFDGTNDGVNIYSTSFRDVFNGQSGTLAFWLKNSGWADGTTRRSIYLYVDGTNYIFIDALNSADTLRYYYVAGGTTSSTSKAAMNGIVSTNWFHVALTWTNAGDTVQPYCSGAAEGAPLTGLGAWAGSLASGGCAIGSSGIPVANAWKGNIAHVAVWTTPLSAAQIATLAKV